MSCLAAPEAFLCFRILLWADSPTPVPDFDLLTVENLKLGVKVVGQKVRRLLGRFGGTSSLNLHSATL